MLTIALTGGIGSGKTTVCQLFHEIGQQQVGTTIKIIDADLIAKNLLSGYLDHSTSSALRDVFHLFGSDLFVSDSSSSDSSKAKQLDRQRLRQLIFSSAEKKQQLEALLHPLVYQEIFSKISFYREQYQQLNNKLIIIIAIPLLLETQSEHKFDRILVIDTTTELQLERSSKRDQCSQDLIKKIIQSQVDRQTRLNAADDIIDNDGTLNFLQKQIIQLVQYYSSLSNN